MEIEIVIGDVTKTAVDAIVNAANDELWMGGGVAGAIKSAGGSQIERGAMAQGPIEPGSAVVASAGRGAPPSPWGLPAGAHAGTDPGNPGRVQHPGNAK